jgi:hypothetical protein
MPDALLQLLIELAEDPLLEREFKADPERAMAGRDLSSQERQALVSRDPAKIRALLVESPPDRDWLLLAWLGSLAAADEGEAL